MTLAATAFALSGLTACGGEAVAPTVPMKTLQSEDTAGHTPSTRNDLDETVPAVAPEHGSVPSDGKLPFAPAISMDPVDGSKVTITASTPTTEHDGRIYFFSSDETLKTFLAEPARYAKKR